MKAVVGEGQRTIPLTLTFFIQQHTSFSHVYNLSTRKSAGVIFKMFYSLLIEKSLESVISSVQKL